MLNKTFALTLAILAGFSVSACAQRATDLPPGKYESESKSTDEYGTTYKTKKVTDVEVDQYGNKKATVTTKSSKDPEGLFNKSTTQSKTVVDER